MASVAIDIRTSYPSGIYRYASSLLAHLTATLSQMGTRPFVLYGPNLLRPQVESLAESLSSSGAELILVPDEVGFGRDSGWLRQWLARQNVGLYHSFNYIVDVRCPLPYIFTIYDLIRLKHPGFSYTDAAFRRKFGEREFTEMTATLEALKHYVPEEAARDAGSQLFTKYFWSMMRYLTEQSLHVVTISEAVKLDITRLLGVSPDKISVVPGATREDSFRRRAPEETAAALRRFNLGRGEPYCLYVGANPLHKRLPWLIGILGRCAGRLPAGAKLLVAGKHRGEDASLDMLVREWGLDDVVVFTGEVTDEELACLYSGARALIVSSIDEGFCLPALEALCCACEVIAPEISVMYELTSGCGHFYASHDEAGLSRYLIEAYDGCLPRRAGRFRNRFSWRASAEQLAGLLQSSLGSLRGR